MAVPDCSTRLNSTLATRSYSTIAGLFEMKKNAFSSGNRKPSFAFIEQRIDFDLSSPAALNPLPFLIVCTFLPVNAEKTFASTDGVKPLSSCSSLSPKRFSITSSSMLIVTSRASSFGSCSARGGREGGSEGGWWWWCGGVVVWGCGGGGVVVWRRWRWAGA